MADGDGERVAHVEAQVEARQLGCGDRVDIKRRVEQFVENRRGALAGHRRRALSDHPDASDRARSERCHDVLWEGRVTDHGTQRTVALSVRISADLAAQRLREAERRFGDLLEEEVRGVTAVDVTGRDLRNGYIIVADRQLGTVIGVALDAVEISGVGGVDRDDLAALFAVHPHVAGGLLHDAIRLARHDVAVVGESHVQPLAAPS